MAEEGALVGTTIAGKYRVKRLVGVGGMGAVYEGLHVDLAKRVAIKIIDSASVMSAELATRFRREARAASAVESEGIVQVFDVGRDPEVGLFMVMEFLQGEDLEARLRKLPGRQLDPSSAAQIGHQVAKALVKAHAARVIHRDLKPANIFLTERDDGSLRVKVLDFGISKLLASEASIATNKDGILMLTAAGVALGTPQYMSPEQAQGLTTVDHRTDVWGLGVVLYEALSGQPAYPELRTYQETIMKILTERPVPLSKIAPHVPAELVKVVHDAVEHDVAKRIQDCGLFAARLAQAMPELAPGSTGPFRSASKARSGSMAGVSVPVKPAPEAPRPITIGNDTQVVVRPSAGELGDSFDEHLPSQTMMADSVPSNLKGPPKVVVNPPKGEASAAAGEPEQGPMSTGDPTMFQPPAWVEAPGDRPSTMKSGLAVPEPRRPTTSGWGTRPLEGAVAAGGTALLVIGVGLGVLALTRPAPSPAGTSAGTGAAAEVAPAVAEERAEEPAEQGLAAAPPATGTATESMPMPPSTGTPAEAKADGGG